MVTVFLNLLFCAACETMPADAAGCQVGSEVPSFFVREVAANRPNLATCLVCRYGERPVVLLCVRELDPQIEQLLTEVDRLVDSKRGVGLRGFALFTGEQAATQPRLMTLTRREQMSLPLAFPVETGGPIELRQQEDARVTVVCYAGRKIVFSEPFAAGEMKPESIDKVLETLRGFFIEYGK
jgi:hypothetical protein